QVATIEHRLSEPGGTRQCRRRDAGAVAALAFRCVRRRGHDGSTTERIVRLAIAPVTMFLFAVETHYLWINTARTAVVSVQPSRRRHRTKALVVVTLLVPAAFLVMAGFALATENEILVACLFLMALLF